MKHIYKILFIALIIGLSYDINSQTVVYQQDFETGAGDWVLQGAWQVGDVATNSSEFWVYPSSNTGSFASANDDALQAGGNASGLLISPDLDFSGATELVLIYSAHYVHGNYASAGQEQLGVRVSTDGGVTWVSIFEHSGPATGFGRNAVSLSDYAGQSAVKIAFEYNDGGNWNFGAGIDDITILQPKERSAFVTLTDDTYKVIDAAGETRPYNFVLTNTGSEAITQAHIMMESAGKVFETMVETNIGLGENTDFSIEFPEGWYDLTSAKVHHINGVLGDDEPSDLSFAVISPIPNFSQTDINGNVVDLHSLLARGHVVTLDYYASWCTQCQAASVELNNTWVDLGEGSNGFDVLALPAVLTDNADIVSALDWGTQYNRFATSFKTDVMWEVQNAEFGATQIPMFIQICPNTENPGFSTVSFNSVGYPANADMTALDSQPVIDAAQTCDPTIGTDTFVDGWAAGIDDIAALNKLAVYPNPVDASSKLFFSLEKEEVVFVSITDMVGKTIYTNNMGEQFGEVQVSLSDIDFSNGVYTVNVQIGSEIASTKINVLR